MPDDRPDVGRRTGGDRSGTEPASDGDARDADGRSARNGGGRHGRLRRYPTPGPHNSLWSWPGAKHPLRVVFNYVAIVLARHAPSLRLKNWLLRSVGVTVGSGVSWGLESTPDVFWPELVAVGEDAIVGYDATLLCHEFLQEEYRIGEVRVGERAMIGAGTVVLPGVEIGPDAQIAANSLVAEDVPAGETWAGVPAEPVSTAGKSEAARTGEAAGAGEAAGGTGAESEQ
ncbi:O-acetyltransferase (homolog to galactoside O-acetyltransferase) [Natronomonas moolapensis 8.8.11]|uniref:O-acetyltransferase (Homolog to galactoside O-acetyltransferase) n=1 Tax=Natronomonas moolapensis (strain DSM 18674 / CECT 7526 / JCM 14361 / 8.8.11) TaxID=268739 RepID=M1XS67_NATM8|nr:O-acetyltransferase (homolog to galactoside O-acetyltransferase) [Natronomonas moolapensis 8.8.11]